MRESQRTEATRPRVSRKQIVRPIGRATDLLFFGNDSSTIASAADLYYKRSSFQPTLQTMIRWQREGRHSHTQMVHNILHLAPRHPANTERITTRKCNANCAKQTVFNAMTPVNAEMVATGKSQHAGSIVSVVTSAQNFEDAPRASATTRREHCKCRHFRAERVSATTRRESCKGRHFRAEFQGRSTRQRDDTPRTL